MLGALFCAEWLATSVSCVSKQICVDDVCVSSGDVRMVFVKSWYTNEGCFRSPDDDDGPFNVLEPWGTKERHLREQRTYAGQKTVAQKKLLKSFMLFPRKSDGRTKVWARKVLLLF